MGNTLNGKDSDFYVDMENATNHRADLIEYTPSGGLSSTNLQDAVDEISGLLGGSGLSQPQVLARVQGYQ